VLGVDHPPSWRPTIVTKLSDKPRQSNDITRQVVLVAIGHGSKGGESGEERSSGIGLDCLPEREVFVGADKLDRVVLDMILFFDFFLVVGMRLVADSLCVDCRGYWCLVRHDVSMCAEKRRNGDERIMSRPALGCHVYIVHGQKSHKVGVEADVELSLGNEETMYGDAPG
jgi:hypothetical protein